MTSQEFINKYFGVNDGKERYCSSIMKDGKGNIYSYGYHYPLLFKVNGKTFRNVAGYSNSTSRHIHWTRDINAIDIHAIRSFRLVGTDDEIMERIIFSQNRRVADIKEVMQSKKRKNTQVYKNLFREFNKAQRSLIEARS